MEYLKTAYFDAYEHGCFEIKLNDHDVHSCYHMGVCDGDVEAAMEQDYIKEQVSKITNEALEKVLVSYGCDFDEKDRHDMEALIVWLAASDIQEQESEEE